MNVIVSAEKGEECPLLETIEKLSISGFRLPLIVQRCPNLKRLHLSSDCSSAEPVYLPNLPLLKLKSKARVGNLCAFNLRALELNKMIINYAVENFLSKQSRLIRLAIIKTQLSVAQSIDNLIPQSVLALEVFSFSHQNEMNYFVYAVPFIFEKLVGDTKLKKLSISNTKMCVKNKKFKATLTKCVLSQSNTDLLSYAPTYFENVESLEMLNGKVNGKYLPASLKELCARKCTVKSYLLTRLRSGFG